MTLLPYPDVSLRRYKVWKHVFDHLERWWEVYGSFEAWGADWNRLRGAGCDRTPAGGDAARRAERAAPILDAHHAGWFGAAERAWTEARAERWFWPTDRADVDCFVGRDGVTVYVAVRSRHLVTCFRPLVPEARARRADPHVLATERATRRAQSARAGVRRAARHASLAAERP